MRAVLFTKWGSVEGLVLRDIPRPGPGPAEVLVRVHATTVTSGDVVVRKMPFLLARLFGIRRKSMLGHEFAGVVESVGADVSRFAVGDRVFGTTTGLTTGAYAEYIAVPEGGMLATVPAAVSLEQAAAVPIGALTALHLLRSGGIRADQRVLVIGASGSVGSFAVQLARAAGAEVSAVASGRNHDLVRSLGAERVIDYTREDVTTRSERYDLVVDAVGGDAGRRGRRILADGGKLVSVRSSTSEQVEDLQTIRDHLDRGRMRAVVDRRYGLDQIREAHTYVERGHKRGNVVIEVAASQAG